MTIYTLPYNVLGAAPFLKIRHADLQGLGFEYQPGAGGSLSGGEGYLVYRKGATTVRLHTNGNVKLNEIDLGYPMWEDALVAIKAAA